MDLLVTPAWPSRKPEEGYSHPMTRFAIKGSLVTRGYLVRSCTMKASGGGWATRETDWSTDISGLEAIESIGPWTRFHESLHATSH